MIFTPKSYFLFFVCILFVQAVFSQPVITSFSPLSGPVGTTVTITGSGFSANAADNIVYFGGVRGQVISSSVSSINVEVPVGATYDLISVTENKLIGFSGSPFIITFPGATSNFPQNLFVAKVDFPVSNENHGEDGFKDLVVVDLDNDGKTDIISPDLFAKSISILRNNSTTGSIAFDSVENFSALYGVSSVIYGDLDGDGKQDVIASNSIYFSVFRNLSTQDNIQFAPRLDFNKPSTSIEESLGDLDGDGKIDLAFVGNNSNKISLYHNASSQGNILFDSSIDISISYGHNKILIRDINGDSKPDIILSYWGLSENQVFVYENLSTPGHIIFDNAKKFNTAPGPSDIAIGDLDNDGLPEIVTSNNQNETFSILRNISNTNTISFASHKDFVVGRFPQCIAINDIDGDGKCDIAVTNNQNLGNTVSLFKNISTNGIIDFKGAVEFTTSGTPNGVDIADFDGDSKPEPAIFCTSARKISILVRCQPIQIIKEPTDTTLCFSGNAIFSVKISSPVTYHWQINNGSGWIDLNNDITYSGVTSNTLIVSGTTTAMNGYLYRCALLTECGTIINTDSAKLIVDTPSPPSIQITASDSIICKGTTVTFNATPFNGGSSPAYQWKKNNINTGINSENYTDNNLNDGYIVKCVITSNASCLSIDTAESNSITIKVTTQIKPEILITASSDTICSGTPVTFIAVIKNGGSSPSYQWFKNKIATGKNINIYIDSTLKNNDTISCTLTSSLSCSITNIASNQIAITVNPFYTPAIIITASENNICPNTTVTFSSALTHQGNNPIFDWLKNGISTGITTQTYTDNNIQNNDIISCWLISNSNECLTSDSVLSNTITIYYKSNLPGPVKLGADKVICSNANITINAPAYYASYIWQDNSTKNYFTTTQPGICYVTATDFCGQVSSDTLLITTGTNPSSFLFSDTSVCSYEPIELKADKIFQQYLWNTNAITPSITINTAGTYWLQVTDENNCTGRDSIKVLPKNCISGVYFPSAFTPNNDGKNDFFKPLVYAQLKQFDFKVFNRFGQLLFHSTETGKGWNGTYNGTLQPIGVYVWVCSYEVENNNPVVKRGAIILIK